MCIGLGGGGGVGETDSDGGHISYFKISQAETRVDFMCYGVEEMVTFWWSNSGLYLLKRLFRFYLVTLSLGWLFLESPDFMMKVWIWWCFKLDI